MLTPVRLLSFRTLSAVTLPLLLAAGGCTVVHDAPPREAVYEPAPQPEPVVQQELRYEPAPPTVVVEYERDLGPYGRWVQTEYGRCWVPADRPRDWQPYTVGHWEDTDRGWCWVAEGPESDWGAVTYHYGRWYSNPSYGWVWVPGDVWSPAWVSWREGGGYCGWYPLPPQVGYGVDTRVEVIDRYCPPERYVYCDERYVAEPSVYRHVENRNVTIINRTTNITNITYVNNRVENRGVSVRNVEDRSGRHVERAQLAEANNSDDARRFRQEGRAVVYAPPVVARSGEQTQARIRQAAAAPAYRQTGNHQTPSNYPQQSSPNRAANGPADHQAAQEQARQRVADEKAQAQQRAAEKQEALRQESAARLQAEEQKRAQVEAEEAARKQAMIQHEEQMRQEKEAARAQQQSMKEERAAERAQAAQAERERAAAQAERQKAAREAKQKPGPSAPGQQGGRNKPDAEGQPRNPDQAARTPQ